MGQHRPSARDRRFLRPAPRARHRRSARGSHTWAKVALIALILYVAGVLVPLAAWIFAVQRQLVQSAWSTGNVALVALALAAALAMGLLGWLKRLAQRV